MKTIIWDMFGGGCNSVKKALKNENVEIYTFDILDTFKDTILIDLTKNNIVDYLEKMNLPKPDIIFASPPCMSFSRAAAMKYENTIGNATWFWKDDKLESRPKHHYENKRYKFESQNEKGLLGAKLISNLIKIIEFYKPEYWYIENPEMSLIWDYMKNNLNWKKGINNIAWYGCYGTEYKKPTNFLSNIKFNLKNKCDVKFKSFEYASKQGINRSLIPQKIIQDIYKEITYE